ncbi:MAG TPA: hypothetical protein IAB45_05495 [Candidatus Onthousia faecavium]|nr:hypothetical protein [Candidatus Onthousia faecavium]
MAMTGFNPELVNSTINRVSQSYENLNNVLVDSMQNKIINGLSDKWACNVAVEFFNNFTQVYNQFLNETDNTFDSIYNSISSAGQAWANSTETSYVPPRFSTFHKKVNSSCIQENIGGVRGIDREQANSVAAILPVLASSASTICASLEAAVQNSGFLGDGQEESLVAKIKSISSNLNKIVEDVNTQFRSAVDNTVSAYGDLAGEVSRAFAGQE